MRWRVVELLFVLVLIGLASCKGDDYHYPDLMTEVVEADTDSYGFFRTVRTDDKAEYHVTKNLTFEGSRPDTTYRARCRYVVADDKTIEVYGLQLLISPHPQYQSYFTSGLKTDPVKLIGIWKSGNYINLRVGVMTKEEHAHKLHFVKSETQPTVMGKSRVDIQLYHDQAGDFEAYTKEAYLSCPLSSLGLMQGDSIYFSVQTYDGKKTFGFVK